jgi:hypothetical protein
MTSKCNRCNLPIDKEREAFVTMPNAERCGFRSRRPTAFAHASCFERDVRAEAARQAANDGPMVEDDLERARR